MMHVETGGPAMRPLQKPKAEVVLESEERRYQWQSDVVQRRRDNRCRFSLLTPEEEIKLAAQIKRGDGVARERMLNANLRLVVTIAHEYTNLGLPLLDLISEGNIGLTKAVERFDPAKKAKLRMRTGPQSSERIS